MWNLKNGEGLLREGRERVRVDKDVVLGDAGLELGLGLGTRLGIDLHEHCLHAILEAENRLEETHGLYWLVG